MHKKMTENARQLPVAHLVHVINDNPQLRVVDKRGMNGLNAFVAKSHRERNLLSDGVEELETQIRLRIEVQPLDADHATVGGARRFPGGAVSGFA